MSTGTYCHNCGAVSRNNKRCTHCYADLCVFVGTMICVLIGALL